MSGKVERRVPLPAYVTVDGAKYYPEGTIESLEAERDELRATVERYREALFAVDDVEECDSCPPDHSCGCALSRAREIARDALVPFHPNEED